MTTVSTNVQWQEAVVTRTDREHQNAHKSCVVWFTGLSGAGKSTLAHAVEHELYKRSVRTYVLDGDNVRHGLCGDLGFSPEDRSENIRRIGEVSNLFVQAGVVVLTAFISPFREDRRRVRELVGSDFIEIYCHCPISVCEQRDVKGLYQKARSGGIKEFTGVTSPYEAPEAAELVVNTAVEPLESCVEQVLDYLSARSIIASR